MSIFKLLVDARTLGSKPSGVGMYLYNYICAIREAADWEIVLVSDVAESDEIRALTQRGAVGVTHLESDEVTTLKSECLRTPELHLKAIGSRQNNAAVGDNIRLRTMGDGTHSVAKSAGVFGYFRFVQQAIDEERPDIFWEPNNVFPTHLKNPYGKIITTIHDVLPMTFPECYTRIYPYYFRWAMRNTLKRSDAILYDSEVSKAETERFFGGAIGKKSLIAYAIVDASEKSEVLSQVGAITKSKDNADYFLYIGNLERRKGTDILIRAYEKYKKGGGERDLVLAGKIRDDDIARLIREVNDGQTIKVTRNATGDENNGIQDKISVRYLGYVDNEQKKEHYRNCYAYVFPTRAEGFGMPVIEALSYGKPVIASDLPIIREIAPVGVTWLDINVNKSKVDETPNMKADSEYLDSDVMTNSDSAVDRLAMIMNTNLSFPSDDEIRTVTDRYKSDVLVRKLVDFVQDWN